VFSRKDFNYFRSLKLTPVLCKTGVDINKFKPTDLKRKGELRPKYGFKIDDKIILHVGHINVGRNIEILKSLPGEGYKVVVAGSTSTDQDRSLINDLEKAGIKILNSYIQDIEEIYQLSDVYIFPVVNDHSAIEFPLSVLEAMSCNLPVVTTAYGSLPDFFPASDCFFYFTYPEELSNYVSHALISECNNRDTIITGFFWESVLRHLFNNIDYNDFILHGN